MYTLSPTGIFGTGVVVDGNGITIPYSSLESYSSDTSGDVREFFYSVLEKVTDVLVTLPATGTGRRWEKVRVTRSSSILGDEVLRKTYNVSCDLNIGELNVVDE